MSTETIVLAGGCFWCLEAVFDRVRGVLDVESGYANGHVPDPGYAQVCTGRTGHAEVVRVVFDPARIGLRELLEIFFLVHDPTTLNCQGNDVGTQYRSGIYCTAPAQKAVAEAVIGEWVASRGQGDPVVTEILPLGSYYAAEEAHQDYFLKHPNQGYCALVVGPKVEKFRHTFAHFLKDD